MVMHRQVERRSVFLLVVIGNGAAPLRCGNWRSGVPGIRPLRPIRHRASAGRPRLPDQRCRARRLDFQDGRSVAAQEHEHAAGLRSARRDFQRHVEMSKAGIEDAIARGMLEPDYDPWNVLDAWYADHLSDAALEWLVNNKVIEREQRNDAVAILRSISDWLERAGP
jgi:hypothetical protein